MSDWRLGIDYGASETIAAVWADGQARRLTLGRGLGLPSLVHLAPDGSLVAGDQAHHLAQAAPERSMALIVRLLGSREPLFPGVASATALDAAAATLRLVLDVAARDQGGRPASVRVGHPARWRAARRQALFDAAQQAGIEHPLLIPAPIATAHRLAPDSAPGDAVAIYSLGALTCETAVVQRSVTGWQLLGQPGSLELGGDDLDRVLLEHLTAQLSDAERSLADGDDPDQRHAAALFLASTKRAREELSTRPTAIVEGPAGRVLRITRDELDEVLAQPVQATVDHLAATIDGAGLGPGLSAVLLTGGASRVPLAERLIADRFGRAPVASDDRSGDVALGAASMPAGDEAVPALKPLVPPRPKQAGPQPPAVGAVPVVADVASDAALPVAAPEPVAPLAAQGLDQRNLRPTIVRPATPTPGRPPPAAASGRAPITPRESGVRRFGRTMVLIAAAVGVLLVLVGLAFPGGLANLLGGLTGDPAGSPTPSITAGSPATADPTSLPTTPRPSPSPTRAPTPWPTPTAVPTPDAQSVLAAMLPAGATDCSPLDLGDGDLAALECQADAVDHLWYILKASRLALDSSVASLRTAMEDVGIVSDETVCPGGEWRYGEEAIIRGDLICFVGTDGTAIIVSTLDERLVWQRLERDDGDLRALYASWALLVPLRPSD